MTVSSIVRVKHRGRETAATLLEADNMSVRTSDDGEAILELFRYGSDGRAVESYQMRLCVEDRQRLKAIL